MTHPTSCPRAPRGRRPIHNPTYPSAFRPRDSKSLLPTAPQARSSGRVPGPREVRESQPRGGRNAPGPRRACEPRSPCPGRVRPALREDTCRAPPGDCAPSPPYLGAAGPAPAAREATTAGDQAPPRDDSAGVRHRSPPWLESLRPRLPGTRARSSLPRSLVRPRPCGRAARTPRKGGCWPPRNDLP